MPRQQLLQLLLLLLGGLLLLCSYSYPAPALAISLPGGGTEGPGREGGGAVSCAAECLKPGVEGIRGQCGRRAEVRGEGQRVVAMSFWGGTDTGYYRGILDNLAALKDHYTGWVLRLYVDPAKLEPSALEDLCATSCQEEIFDLCSVDDVPTYGDLSKVFGMVWRFLPVSDPFVDVYVSRDLDSRLTAREAATVDEWLHSNHSFHVMRDNPYHNTAILGGMWGARLDTGLRLVLDAAMRKLVEDTAKHGAGSKGLDQSMLTTWVWPEVRGSTLVHDSFLCGHNNYRGNEWRPFPTRREPGPYNFVGAAGPMELKSTCPELCRPAAHQDWTLC